MSTILPRGDLALDLEGGLEGAPTLYLSGGGATP